MSQPIISVSGLRGIVGSELTPEVAIQYVAAYCGTLPRGVVVIGRDGRASGPMLARGIAAALMGHGMTVLDADVIATPSLGVLVRHHQAVAGIQISASHNPIEYNGFKLFNRQGRVIPADEGAKVLEAYRQRRTDWKSVDSIGGYAIAQEPHKPHLDAVLDTVDGERIRKRGFRVLLDSNHGAGSPLGQLLLQSLGCQCTILGAEPDGAFEHPPEPLEQNLVAISEHIRQGSFDIGFCQDPDADRLAIIDEGGRYIGEEFTSVLCMLHRLSQNPGPVVTNCASSSMSAWLAEKHAVPFYRSKVGEANVVDTMLRVGAVFGGEGSGGPIDPRVGFVRDSFVGMAQVLDLLAAREQSVSQVVASLPAWTMIKDKMTLTSTELTASIERLKSAMHAPSIDTQDGVRLDWNDRWLLLRGSNTEPIVRLIAEAPSPSIARGLIDEAKEILQKYDGRPRPS